MPPDQSAGSLTAINLSPGSAGRTASTKRLQVPRACERCKRLRRGCSDFRPCQRCVDSKLAHQCRSDVVPLTAILPGTLDYTHPGAAHQRITQLLPNPVIDYCVERFFERLYPTIPILTTAYITRLRSVGSTPDGLESLCILLGMCGQVLLQTEEPEELFRQGIISEMNLNYGRILLDTAVFVWQTLPRHAPITIEVCLFAFFLYACEAVLSHHSRAFRYLRETTTLLLLYQNEAADDAERLVSSRLFYVLLISERSHAIRYRRPITLQVTEETPGLDILDPSLLGFLSLAALFRPLDTSFIALLNHEISAISPPPEYINDVEARVNSALGSGFGLYDTQKANLRVTQLWLRIVIWKLRLHLGHLVEESFQHSLTFRYPIEVAKDLMLSTRDLPASAFKVHGVGMTEKLFDIASALVDVLARIPITPTSPSGVVANMMPANDLSYLRSLIQKSPSGDTIYDELMEKHIQQTVPSLATRLPRYD
jgi:hypothetical protein